MNTDEQGKTPADALNFKFQNDPNVDQGEPTGEPEEVTRLLEALDKIPLENANPQAVESLRQRINWIKNFKTPHSRWEGVDLLGSQVGNLVNIVKRNIFTTNPDHGNALLQYYSAQLDKAMLDKSYKYAPKDYPFTQTEFPNLELTFEKK